MNRVSIRDLSLCNSHCKNGSDAELPYATQPISKPICTVRTVNRKKMNTMLSSFLKRGGQLSIIEPGFC